MRNLHIWGAIALTALVLAFSMLFLRGGFAQDITVGTGLICDTAEQVEQYAAAFKGDSEATLAQVNNGTTACGVMAFAYVRGEDIKQVSTKDGMATIVKIAVMGINLGGGWVRGTPLTQYTLFLIRGREA